MDRYLVVDEVAVHDLVLGVAVIRLAAARRCHARAWALCWAIADYLDWRGRWRELADTQQTALAAVRALDDASRQADAHRTIGPARPMP